MSNSNNKEQEIEFYRRKNLTGVEVRYLNTNRATDIHLSYCGKHYGSKSEVYRRKKVVSTLYILPKIDR